MARIDPDKRVYVYFNLHKKCFSVKQSGKVVSHDDCVLLKDCRFLVGDAGRERVLKEKKKNAPRALSLKVSQKGAVSVYGLGRFPVTLYPAQMQRLLSIKEEIETFIADNKDSFSYKS